LGFFLVSRTILHGVSDIAHQSIQTCSTDTHYCSGSNKYQIAFFIVS